MNQDKITYIIMRIEEKIGYRFQSEALLIQALTRKAYHNEHPESPHNEVMEHFGDATVGRAIKRALRKKYTFIDERGYLISSLDEGELTTKANAYVSNASLAKHINRMGLMEYAFLGKGEIKQDCGEQENPQADLFEAIVYAVELDCDENTDTVMQVVLHMMGFSDYSEI